jgi:hypothetical protein
MAVFRTDLFLPLTMVAEEIPESTCLLLKSKPQKGKIPVRNDRVLAAVGWQRSIQHDRDNQRTRIVIGCVALSTIRQAENSMLQDARVVGHAQ